MRQQKRLPDGRLASWRVDRQSLASVAPWVAEAPERLDAELAELEQHFPTWLVTVGKLSRDAGWPYAWDVPCAQCGELLVPDQGIRCCACRRPEPRDDLLVGFAGRLPTLATGRPVLRRVRERAEELRSQGQGAKADALGAYFLEVGGQSYFAPPVWVFCPSSFPHGEPFVMVRPQYFRTLGIPADHVYPSTRWRLCNYAHWHEVSVRTVLQQRVVPRIYLDLMVADLQALGRLQGVLDALDLSLHALYNAAGRGSHSARFGDLYRSALAD